MQGIAQITATWPSSGHGGDRAQIAAATDPISEETQDCRARSSSSEIVKVVARPRSQDCEGGGDEAKIAIEEVRWQEKWTAECGRKCSYGERGEKKKEISYLRPGFCNEINATTCRRIKLVCYDTRVICDDLCRVKNIVCCSAEIQKELKCLAQSSRELKQLNFIKIVSLTYEVV